MSSLHSVHHHVGSKGGGVGGGLRRFELRLLESDIHLRQVSVQLSSRDSIVYSCCRQAAQRAKKIIAMRKTGLERAAVVRIRSPLWVNEWDP